MAQEIKNVLEKQRQEWIEKRMKLNLEQESLEERETIHVAASVYLVNSLTLALVICEIIRTPNLVKLL